MRNKKKGFTLVELIVVIAIIGVLAAIIVPTTLHFVNQGREEAANTELTEIKNAVNTGLTGGGACTPAGIKAILEAASINGTGSDNTVTITIVAAVPGGEGVAGTPAQITFESSYDGVTTTPINLTGVSGITAGTVTVGPSSITVGQAPAGE